MVLEALILKLIIQEHAVFFSCAVIIMASLFRNMDIFSLNNDGHNFTKLKHCCSIVNLHVNHDCCLMKFKHGCFLLELEILLFSFQTS